MGNDFLMLIVFCTMVIIYSRSVSRNLRLAKTIGRGYSSVKHAAEIARPLDSNLLTSMRGLNLDLLL